MTAWRSEQFQEAAPVNRWPGAHAAREAGCTCEWWGGGAIVEFDGACPILHRHKDVPWNVNQTRLPV